MAEVGMLLRAGSCRTGSSARNQGGSVREQSLSAMHLTAARKRRSRHFCVVLPNRGAMQAAPTRGQPGARCYPGCDHSGCRALGSTDMRHLRDTSPARRSGASCWKPHAAPLALGQFPPFPGHRRRTERSSRQGRSAAM